MFVDTPTFAIELLYPRDVNYAINHRFLETQAGAIKTSIYNVLELCGIASYRLTQDELDKVFYAFEERFQVQVLYPQVADDIPSTLFLDELRATTYLPSSPGTRNTLKIERRCVSSRQRNTWLRA